MKRLWAIPFGLILLASLSLSVSPQQVASQAQISSAQKEGLKLYQQRCSVCHMPPARSNTSYGPRLYNFYVEDNEERVRDIIMEGREGGMPGWKYALQPDQIDAIIEYLKTVERPARPKS